MLGTVETNCGEITYAIDSHGMAVVCRFGGLAFVREVNAADLAAELQIPEAWLPTLRPDTGFGWTFSAAAGAN